MSFLVVANFKSNKSLDQVEAWLKSVPKTPNVVVAPSFLHLPLATKLWGSAVCSQDVSPFPSGAYTGAVNATQLKDLGISYSLIGHSERRHYFHESVVEIANKAKELLEVGITPIICMEDSEIVTQFGALEDELVSKCHYCFEPRDIIGGTNIADLNVIESTINKIKSFAPSSIPMYGGSVNQHNIGELIKLGLGGTIVSSACLDADNFKSLLSQIPHEKN